MGLRILVVPVHALTILTMNAPIYPRTPVKGSPFRVIAKAARRDGSVYSEIHLGSHEILDWP